MKELKPCPFCGGKVKKKTISPVTKIVMFVCKKCGAYVCFYVAEPKATKAWNRRVNENVD